ncbi:MAG: (2Fe-2S) ferredoxin domain-containing protein [Acidobacteria bacterium]|nr:(2Fe-2S) ferredoxin domain-containing protein [Acidobacteriota bacterium]
MLYPLETKRLVYAQILVCNGCCCGRTEKGHPAVPIDYLKAEFKARKLIRNVQVTISGCLGPCDVPNVVAILTREEGMRWYGFLSEQWQYESLIEWATEVKEAQRALPLPAWLENHRLDPMATQCASAAVA